MSWIELVPARLRKPGHCRHALRWNLLLLVWSAIMLVAASHTGLIGDALGGGSPAPAVTVVELPEPEQPLAQPLDAPDTAPETNSPADSALVAGLLIEDDDWPKPRVVAAGYSNPGGNDDRRAILSWLSTHQNADGFWSAAGFGENSGRGGAFATHTREREGFGDPNTDAGRPDADLAATSLALLNYVGTGYDHKEGAYRADCRKAIQWLRMYHGPDGFPNARGVRDHALATMALAEIYGLSGDQVLRGMTEECVNQLLKLRLSSTGWGENSWGVADIISTAYALMALKSAKMAGVQVEYELDGVGDFLDFVTHVDGSTDYSMSQRMVPGGERDGFTRPPVCAAAWVVAAILRGHVDHQHALVLKRADNLLMDENLPKWERGRIDFEYWWLATAAMHYAASKDRWERWRDPMIAVLLDNQRGYTEFDKTRGWSSGTLDEYGSWDAADIWNHDGRVAGTALAGLCLELHYRYERIADIVLPSAED